MDKRKFIAMLLWSLRRRRNDKLWEKGWGVVRDHDIWCYATIVGCMDWMEAEAWVLLTTMEFAISLGLQQGDFEINCKTVVDKIIKVPLINLSLV
ncbi:hypothetical protein GYH30_001458 [Glycine max]|nr:hypothetical protein GYH30_001458 [Glycine max]